MNNTINEKETVVSTTEKNTPPKRKTAFRSTKEARKYLNKVSKWASKTFGVAVNAFDKYSGYAILALTGLFLLSIISLSVFGVTPVTLAIANALFYTTIAVDLLYIGRVLYLAGKYIFRGPAQLKVKLEQTNETLEEAAEAEGTV